MADLATGDKNRLEIINNLNSIKALSRAEALTLLRKIKELRGDLYTDSALKESVEKIIGKFEIYSVDSVINALEKNNTEIKNEDFKENRALRKDEMEELMKDYDKYLKKEKLNEEQALKKTIEENKNISQKNIEQLIKRQQELYKKNLEKLELQKKQNVKIEDKVIDFKEAKKVKNKIEIEAEIITKEQVVLENKIEKILEDYQNIDTKEELKPEFKEVAEKISENLANKLVEPEHGSQTEELEKLIETYIEPEKIVELKKEIEEKIEAAEINIKVDNQVEESANKLIDELKTEGKLKDKVERNEIEIKNEVKEVLLEKIGTEEAVAENLSNKIIEVISKNEPILGEQEITAIRIETTKTEIEANNWINTKNREINIYRGNTLTEKIEAIITNENLSLTKEEIKQVKEYQKLVKEIYYPKDGINIDQYKSESFETALKSGAEPGKVNNETWNDVKGMARIARMTPGQFKEFSEKYNLANNVLKGKLPYGVKECGSLDRIMSKINDNPALRKLLSVSQKMSGYFEKIGGFIPNLKMKLGLKVSGFVIERIGNQAAKAWAQNAMTIFAKNGLEKGMGIVLKGLITKGAVTAGASAAGAGTAAAAAGVAIPGVGWLVAAASLVLSPILNKIKEGLQSIFGEKLGGLLNTGLDIMGGMKLQAFMGKLGKMFGFGGTGGAAAGGTAAVGAGTAATAGAATAGGTVAGAGAAAGAPAIIIVIVVVCVMGGMFGLSLSTNSEAAKSMAPPKGLVQDETNYIEGDDGNDFNASDLNMSFNVPTVNTDFTRTDLQNIAKSIIGVPYFWGGKYSGVGPNPDWGKLKTVTAEGSWSTGKDIPYGLDCSGFVDWAYYQLIKERISGGGGAAEIYGRSIHDISRSDLKIGDVGFLSGKNGDHIGMFIGRDVDGEPLFIQAAGRRYRDNNNGLPAGQVLILKEGKAYNGYTGSTFQVYGRPKVNFKNE